jgi:hypothetical protein
LMKLWYVGLSDCWCW